MRYVGLGLPFRCGFRLCLWHIVRVEEIKFAFALTSLQWILRLSLPPFAFYFLFFVSIFRSFPLLPFQSCHLGYVQCVSPQTSHFPSGFELSLTAAHQRGADSGILGTRSSIVSALLVKLRMLKILEPKDSFFYSF